MSTVTRRWGRGDAGSVGVCLCLVLAFALFAVIQLTRTTLAAEQIDDRVVSITATAPSIDQTLTNVPLLDETNATAQQILAAAQPLSAHLDDVIAAAANIDHTVVGINQTADAIHGTVTSINDTVSSIHASVNGIEGSTSAILSTAGEIRSGLSAINRRIDTILDLAVAIGGDLGNVLSRLGSISQHANSIDCGTLGSGCQR